MLLKKISAGLSRWSVETVLFWTIACWLIKAGVFYLAYTEVLAQGRAPVMCSWDCPYYESIATTGYRYSEVHGNMAFFPLFPLVVKALRWVVPGDFAWLGASMNFLLFGWVIAMFLSFCRQLGLKFWWLPALLWSLDRHTFWAVIPYTEVLFLIWMMAYLLLLRRSDSRRAQFFASLLGGISTANRLVGVALVGAMGLGRFSYFLKRPLWGLLCLLIGLSGVIAYFSYLHAYHGSWQLSLITTSHWGRHFDALGIFRSTFFLLKSFYFPTVLVTGLCLYWVLRPPIRLLNHERWLMAILFLIPIMNSIPISLTRYFSILILGYVAWAYYIERGFREEGAWKERLIAWALLIAVLPEPWWQVKLLAKWLRVEVFNWTG